MFLIVVLRLRKEVPWIDPPLHRPRALTVDIVHMLLYFPLQPSVLFIRNLIIMRFSMEERFGLDGDLIISIEVEPPISFSPPSVVLVPWCHGVNSCHEVSRHQLCLLTDSIRLAN